MSLHLSCPLTVKNFPPTLHSGLIVPDVTSKISPCFTLLVLTEHSVHNENGAPDTGWKEVALLAASASVTLT